MPLIPTRINIIIASLSAFIILAILLTLILLRGRVPFTFSRSNPPSALPMHTPRAKNPHHRTWRTWPTSISLTLSSFGGGEKESTENRENREGSKGSEDVEVEGEYEKYGDLYVPPDKQPTILALDIIMRCLLATGLPGRARVGDWSELETVGGGDGGFEGASLIEKGGVQGDMVEGHAEHVVGPPKVSLDLNRPVSFSPSEYFEIMLSPVQSAGTAGGAEGEVGEQTALRVEEVEKKGKGVDSVLNQGRDDDHVVEPMAEGFGRGKGMARMYC
ncbi:hypothetical protein FB567DRAFT_550144 [Paraphoma chrysanthemicola]|uniref:Uncharacterized protein n=1 Tax=Paraphoma chrysanthemicola TaxID=798071 RepID=A0A8K0VXR4_9PLEO|nr:hypothetical protein FB567DRAFT_550144 [Paraphoma chrysanthemicola]